MLRLYSKISTDKGFTLLEVLLSIALVGVLAGISMPVLVTLQTKNDLAVAAATIAQSFRRAQVLSLAVDGDTAWGVEVQSGSIVVFKGTSYAARDASYDEIFDLPTSITPSGVSEIVFAKMTGNPQTTGTVTLTTTNSGTSTITVNGKGVISY